MRGSCFLLEGNPLRERSGHRLTSMQFFRKSGGGLRSGKTSLVAGVASFHRSKELGDRDGKDGGRRLNSGHPRKYTVCNLQPRGSANIYVYRQVHRCPHTWYIHTHTPTQILIYTQVYLALCAYRFGFSGAGLVSALAMYVSHQICVGLHPIKIVYPASLTLRDTSLC